MAKEFGTNGKAVAPNLAATQFVHLHLHTQYSLLDGANKLPDVLQNAAKLGQPAIGITDHGNLFGAAEFYDAAIKIGIKPIIGCELYVTPGSRFERKTRQQGGSGTHHLTVLAQNNLGYKNLCRLVTLAYREGFYFKPRVDHELLARYSEGLVVLSGCLAGELAQHILLDEIEQARRLSEFYLKNFPGRFFFELQPHPISDQQKLNQGCIELATSLGVPLVATTDCHYSNAADHYAQEVLMCVSTNKTIHDPSRLRHDGLSLHLKSAAEMYHELAGIKLGSQAVAQSLTIAESCNVSFDFSRHYMPVFPVDDSESLIDRMARTARAGLAAHFAEQQREVPKEYSDRLEREISLIDKMGFAGYFLVVADFIVWAKEQGIPVGPGRGSVAGSLVAFTLRITEVDPILHKLLFERFLNPERVSLPDIDVDFCINGRDRVIQYVVDKYGKENVAQIVTFGTLKAKAAIKDVGRALGIGYAETDRIAQLVPAPRQGFDYPLHEALKMEPRLKEYAEGEGKDLISLALTLEGLTRHTSTHAAGVVIGSQPLIEMLPMMVDKDGNDVTQFSMKYVEKIGLVKFDFLGLKTLTVIHAALKLIEESSGLRLNLEKLALNDPKTFALLCGGNTTGVFQLESTGITEMTVRLKPNCFDDLVATLALYRPGPLDAGMVDHYINRKHGREKVTYLHPLMESVLADTYGIMLYQEQIMQLTRELAGYSLAEADLLRKAMGKKDPEEMAKQRIIFISGAEKRGLSNRLAAEIFDQMETFARYGFNRSHSAAYAMISYQTAYLKAHYPVEFMAALMSLEMGDSDKTLKNLNECRKGSIGVLPPDVNQSTAGFSVQAGKIRYGLEAVKGIGEKAVLSILRCRDQAGPFKDFEDLVERVDPQSINRRVLESLIKCGAFDFAGKTRRELFERIDEVMRMAQSNLRDRNSNQLSLFGSVAGADTMQRRNSNRPEWPVNQRLAYEREALGFYISGHPLEKFRSELKRLGTITTEEVKTRRKASVRIAGVVTGLKLKNTKKGDRYATFVLEDWLGTVESIVWPDVYKKISQLIALDDPVVVSGRADVTDERSVFVVDTMDSLTTLRDRSARQGVLRLSADDQFDRHRERLLELLRKHTGRCPLQVRVETPSGDISISLKDRAERDICVVPSEVLCEEVEQLFGRPVLSFL